MSTHIEINGAKLIPLKEVSKRTTYSRDYLSKLAREQKIVATQVGRQWFIGMSSVKVFLDSVTLEQEVCKQHLREERKRELIVKKDLGVLAVDLKNKANHSHYFSFVATAMVLFLGLFTGLVIYETKEIASLEVVALSLNAETPVTDTILSVVEPQATAFLDTVTEYPLFTNEYEVREMNTFQDGVFLLSREGGVGDKENIADLFSDNVSVEFLSENSGVVKYKNSDNKITEIPFVSLPKNKIDKEHVIDPSS